MIGRTHRALGALCGAAVAAHDGQTWAMVAMTALVASATASGPTSPDLDQTATWRTLTRPLPAAIRRHRGLTHWWVLPVAAWLLVATQLPADAHWPAYALIVGWASHLLGDAIFGRLPVLPGLQAGLGLKTDGFLESGRARVLGRTRKVLPISPALLVISAALAYLLIAGFPAGTQAADPVFPPTATTRSR